MNRRSQIVVRMVTFGEEPCDLSATVRRRLDAAVAARPVEGPRRVVFAESDGLPGLVVDRFGDHLVVQITSLGMESMKEDIVSALASRLGPAGIYERSEGDGRKKEGLGPARGVLFGEPPPDEIVAEEEGVGGPVPLFVDVARGHKTGAYLDQRVNRRRVAERCRGKSVLNLFSYTGGFGLHAALAGAAHVMNVDSSKDALALSARIAERAGVAERVEHLQGDAFEVVRDLADRGRRFDVIVVDPPKLVSSRGHLNAGTRAYKDINRIALGLTPDGGTLCTFSCSGLVGADLFQKVLFGAALDAHRDARILERLGQPDDHPVALEFPEAEYLKGLVLRVV